MTDKCAYCDGPAITTAGDPPKQVCLAHFRWVDPGRAAAEEHKAQVVAAAFRDEVRDAAMDVLRAENERLRAERDAVREQERERIAAWVETPEGWAHVSGSNPAARRNLAAAIRELGTTEDTP